MPAGAGDVGELDGPRPSSMATSRWRCDAGVGFVERGLVDEYRVVVHPVILGAGKPYLPALEARIGLRLLETRTSRPA